MKIHLKYMTYGLIAIALIELSCVGCTTKSDVDLFYVKEHIGGTDDEGSVLILLHGYGSNENDLLSLSSLVPTVGDVVSFRAPMILSDNAYCWFPRTGHTADATVDTTLYHQASEVLWHSIKAMVEREGWQGRNLFIAGFSQGAMMSYEMARKHADEFSGIIGFSGSSKALRHMSPTSKCGADLFISHGTNDQVLTYESALDAKSRLEICGAHVSFFAFSGGHQITSEVQSQAKVWLQQRW